MAGYKSMSQLGADIQDAFHYALAAAGGTYGGYESSFAGRNADHTRSEYMRMARAKARQGFEDHAAEWAREARGLDRTLAGAGALCDKIRLFARTVGIDAHSGEPLCMTCRERARDTGCDGLCTECYQAALSAPQYDDHVFYGLPHAGHTQEQIARGEHYQDVRATFVRKTARPLPAPATAAVPFPPCCDDQTPAAHHNGDLYCQACDKTLGHVEPQLTPHAIGILCVALDFYIDSTKEQAADPTQANARSYLESRARQAGELLATFEGLRDGDGLEG